MPRLMKASPTKASDMAMMAVRAVALEAITLASSRGMPMPISSRSRERVWRVSIMSRDICDEIWREDLAMVSLTEFMSAWSWARSARMSMTSEPTDCVEADIYRVIG